MDSNQKPIAIVVSYHKYMEFSVCDSLVNTDTALVAIAIMVLTGSSLRDEEIQRENELL